MDGRGAVALRRRRPAAVHAFGEHQDGAVGARPRRGAALGWVRAVGGHYYYVEERVDVT